LELVGGPVFETKQAVKTRNELIDDEDTRKINKGRERKMVLLGTRLNKGE